MRATVDEAGRVQLPEEAREKLGLHPGSEVDVRVCEHGLEITPIWGEPYLAEKNGRVVIVHPDPSAVVTAEMTNRILEKMRDPVRRHEEDDE